MVSRVMPITRTQPSVDWKNKNKRDNKENNSKKNSPKKEFSAILDIAMSMSGQPSSYINLLI